MSRRDVDIQTEILKTLRAVPEHEDGTELVVVRYIIGGRGMPPQLVNREVYTDRISRQRKHGKTKGLKWADFKFITDPERREEIDALLLDIPLRPRPAARSPQSAAANDEEVPF